MPTRPSITFGDPAVCGLGNLTAGLTVELFVNDFLMAIFFLLVGIELKYEMTVGELKNPRQAMLPMLAAVGGVVVPACIYLIFNHAGAHNGWAIPMATDIAFALGVLSLLGNRVPNGVRVFFSTLAIADDLISIAAIAIFYGQSPNPFWLGAAALFDLRARVAQQDSALPPCPVFGTGSAAVVLHVQERRACYARRRHLGLYHPGQVRRQAR